MQSSYCRVPLAYAMLSFMIMQDLEARGLVKQVTSPDLEKALNHESLTFYCGFDPTADSLHIGSLVPVFVMKLLQDAGHKVIAVVGGATGRIGDPSFKANERSLLSDEQIHRNLRGIESILRKLLNFEDGRAEIIDNAHWTQNMSVIDFLRDVGKYFTVNHMSAKESVRARLEDREQGISFTEFSYMLLQAYDFYWLEKNRGCRLQIGGSDQWGNITAGLDLIRKKSPNSPHCFGLTFPLLVKSDGTKFGKSESGNIWLDSKATSAYKFYQYFISVADDDAIELLRKFSPLNHEKREALIDQCKAEPERRLAQVHLAESLTRWVHGEGSLAMVQQATQTFFGGGDLRSLSRDLFLDVLSEVPRAFIRRDELSNGVTLIDAVVRSGLATSRGQARKDIEGGGISVNQQKNQQVDAKMTSLDVIHDRAIVLRKGKKNYALLLIEEE